MAGENEGRESVVILALRETRRTYVCMCAMRDGTWGMRGGGMNTDRAQSAQSGTRRGIRGTERNVRAIKRGRGSVK